jgi:hypothetical protein
LSGAVRRAASPANVSQSRHLTFKPCRRLPGCHRFGSRPQQLNRQPIGAFALALEICSVIGRPGFELRDFCFHCLDRCP